ncbi:DNA-binding domain-containing protein [Alteromonas ponticola]|uniref:DUF2063 domain-containing protein n=1 Tax=Alteromonas ponticola TaxID=2720613 RepID=A0ABX1R4K6_9ALTE|nr:putative DNA-binding domain-containing protein [Alteromonas ponticola]NMH61367.1 DUF2063 domain-containing protein [Alteromonas ponticola]
MTQSFQLIQQRFVSAVRSGEPVNGDEDTVRRMGIYQSLLFNNVLSFIDSGFPVLKSIIRDPRWHELVRDFFQHWECKSPYFVAISEAFVNFLHHLDLQKEQLPIFALSLAHYEWLELAISIRDEDVTYCDSIDDSKNVRLSPLTSLVSYPFPVHQISSSYQPSEPSAPHHYVVYRDRNNQVNFSKLAPPTAYILGYLSEQHEAVGIDALKAYALSAMPDVDVITVEAGLDVAIADMLQKDILLPAESG